MNFSPQTKAWILLIALTVGTGCVAFTATYAGGCKWWIALVTAIGTSGMQVYHALSASPKDKTESSNTTNNQNNQP